MHRTYCFLLIALALGLFALAMPTAQVAAVPAPGPAGFKWEYKVYTETELQNLTEVKSLEAALNKLGDDGWELVAIRSSYQTPAALAKKGSDALFVLKRLKTGK